jgi:hypothetical protein
MILYTKVAMLLAYYYVVSILILAYYITFVDYIRSL